MSKLEVNINWLKEELVRSGQRALNYNDEEENASLMEIVAEKTIYVKDLGRINNSVVKCGSLAKAVSVKAMSSRQQNFKIKLMF